MADDLIGLFGMGGLLGTSLGQLSQTQNALANSANPYAQGFSPSGFGISMQQHHQHSRAHTVTAFHGMAMASTMSLHGGFLGFPTHPKTGEPLKEGEFFVEVKDHRGRLHSVNGAPAKKFSDGTDEFYWHGVQVPELVARTPEEITVAMVEAEDNAEVRRVMIERYGIQRYMADCGAVLLHKDKTGELYKKNLGQHEEPLVFVKVKNSTPEPDGSIKDYFLRVPPRTKRASEAVAWTFGLTEKEYAPDLET